MYGTDCTTEHHCSPPHVLVSLDETTWFYGLKFLYTTAQALSQNHYLVFIAPIFYKSIESSYNIFYN